MPGPPFPPVQGVDSRDPGQGPIEEGQSGRGLPIVDLGVQVGGHLVAGGLEGFPVAIGDGDQLVGSGWVAVVGEMSRLQGDGIGGDGRHRVGEG